MIDNNKRTNKDIILDAASIAFSKYGYKKTTLDDISSQIDMGKTGIYYYYKNKEEIFKEVVKKEAENLELNILSAIENESYPEEKIKKYIIARMNFLEGISNYYSVLKHEIYERLSFINKNRVLFDDAEFKIVSDILKEGVDKNIFYVERINETALIIINILKGLEIPFFVNNKDRDYTSLLNPLMLLLLNGIKKTKDQ